MTVVLPSPVSPPLLGRRLTEMHTCWVHEVTHTHKHTPCMYMFVIHACTHTIVQRNTTYTVLSQLPSTPLGYSTHQCLHTEPHTHNSMEVASPLGSGTKPGLLHVLCCPAYSASIWPAVAIRNDKLTIARQDWCW